MTRFSGNTDSRGQVSLRGFVGEYEVVATHGNARAKAGLALPRDGNNVSLKLK